MTDIAFTKVSAPFGWLGNMSAYPVEYEGKKYRTTEALFQCLRFEDEDVIEEIREQKSPMAAKMIAKKHKEKMVVEAGSMKDVKNMYRVLALKLEQHPDLREMLLKTEDRIIIEDCTRRDRGSARVWGAVLVDGEWEGKNYLGKLWMMLRNKLCES
jgi:ribA/ribD-fused uncharacterized protein